MAPLSICGREIGGGNPEIDKLLTGAFLAYTEGHPVVVLDEHEAVLHGVETLKSIVILKCLWTLRLCAVCPAIISNRPHGLRF